MAYSNADGFIPKCVGDYIRKNNLYKFDRSKYTKYVSYLQKNLSEKRFRHSVNVANEALRLAVVYDCDRDRAYEAGLLHDTCKEIPYDKQLELVKRSSSFVDEVELAAPKTYHGIAASVYLKAVSYTHLREYVKKGFSGVRLSTRPDAITPEILGILKKYGVTSIELGAQSMCDDCLLYTSHIQLGGRA